MRKVLTALSFALAAASAEPAAACGDGAMVDQVDGGASIVIRTDGAAGTGTTIVTTSSNGRSIAIGEGALAPQGVSVITINPADNGKTGATDGN